VKLKLFKIILSLELPEKQAQKRFGRSYKEKGLEHIALIHPSLLQTLDPYSTS